ncbi:MAG: tetratricopeptide repeat protein, partial [Acidobacteriota bacterium]
MIQLPGRLRLSFWAVGTVFLAALALLGNLREVWQINRWSLSHAERAIGFPLQSDILQQPPPAKHLRASLWLARAKLRAGNLSAALGLVRPLLARGDRDAQVLAGEVLFSHRDAAAAAELWSKLPNADSLLRVAGQRALKQGWEGDAQLYYETAYAVSPEQSALSLAKFLWRTKSDPSAAEKILARAITDHPDSPFCLIWLGYLGEVFRAQGRIAPASDAYRQVLDRDPRHGIAGIGLGWTLYRKGEVEAAAAQFQKVSALNPDWRAEACYAMGQMLAEEGHHAEAESWLRPALELKPGEHAWWTFRLLLARRAQDLSLALEVGQEMIRRFPDSPQGHYDLAWVLRLLNAKPRQAVGAIERALALIPNPRPRHHFRAGQ